MKFFAEKLLNITHDELIYHLSLSLIYILICFLLMITINFILKILEKKTKKTNHYLNFALISSLEQPIKVCIWSFGLYEVFKTFNENFDFFEETKVVFWVIISLWLSFRFISRYIQRFVEVKESNKEKVNYDSILVMKKITQIITTFMILFIGLGRLGVDLHGLMAIGGIGGMTIGLAAKDTLTNIFAGLTLHIDKPFIVGDWISSPDKIIEGIVEEIGWRQTTIRTFEKYRIYIANSIFSDIVIENKDRADARRIREIIPIRYIDILKISNITEEIKKMLKSHPKLHKTFHNIVYLESIGVGLLNLRIITFTITKDWVEYTEIQQDIFLKAVEIIKQNGGEVSYDTKEIFINNTNNIG